MLAGLGVTLDILHTFDSDLVAELISPAGSSVVLFSGVGGGGRHFSETRLDDRGATPIATGIAPFTGTFLPQQPLATLIGESANGLWKLNVTDTALFDTGTLQRWSLSLGELVVSSTDVPKPISDLTTVSSILNVEAGPGALIQAIAQPPVKGGDGGNIVVQAKTLTIQDGATLEAGTKGAGRGGDVMIKADVVELMNSARLSARSTGTGNAGDVRITSQNLFLTDGGQITTDTTGKGDAGNITLNVGRLLTNTDREGNPLQARRVEISSNSTLTEVDEFFESTTAGRAGAITIRGNSSTDSLTEAADAVVLHNANLRTTVAGGTPDTPAASITITAQTATLTASPELSVQTAGEAGGPVNRCVNGIRRPPPSA